MRFLHCLHSMRTAKQYLCNSTVSVRLSVCPCKKRVVGVGVVVCLERGADLHTAQLMPLPLSVSCYSNIQIGFTFLVPAYPGCPGKEAVKWL